MKKILILCTLLIYMHANQTQYTIDNSKLRDGNSLIFYDISSAKNITIAIEGNELKFPISFFKSGYKFENLKIFFKNVFSKNTILTVPQLFNKIAKTYNIESLLDKDIIIAYGDKIYSGKLEVKDEDDAESIFDDMATVFKIVFQATKELDLNDFRIRNLDNNAILSLSKDSNGNILSFGIFNRRYKLVYVTNKYLKRYNFIKEDIKKTLNFSSSPIIVKYIKKDKRRDIIIREVHYKLERKGEREAIIVNITDKNRASGTTSNSFGELYEIEQNNLLFQLRGNIKIDSFEKYSFEQYPSSMLVKVKSNNSFSRYYRKSIYYYNKAGLWYLMIWLKKKGLNHKNAYVFYENNNAKLYKITDANSNTLKVNEKDATFFPSTNLIKEYNGFHFFDIENNTLKEMRKKYNIIRLYR